MKDLITRRLFPLQILGSAAHKIFRLHLALAADASSADLALLRTVSLAFDMGVESNILAAPRAAGGQSTEVALLADSNRLRSNPLDLIFPARPPSNIDDPDNFNWSEVERLCPRAMPLGDADHAAGRQEQHFQAFYSRPFPVSYVHLCYSRPIPVSHVGGALVRQCIM